MTTKQYIDREIKRLKDGARGDAPRLAVIEELENSLKAVEKKIKAGKRGTQSFIKENDINDFYSAVQSMLNAIPTAPDQSSTVGSLHTGNLTFDPAFMQKINELDRCSKKIFIEKPVDVFVHRAAICMFALALGGTATGVLAFLGVMGVGPLAAAILAGSSTAIMASGLGGTVGAFLSFNTAGHLSDSIAKNQDHYAVVRNFGGPLHESGEKENLVALAKIACKKGDYNLERWDNFMRQADKEGQNTLDKLAQTPFRIQNTTERTPADVTRQLEAHDEQLFTMADDMQASDIKQVINHLIPVLAEHSVNAEVSSTEIKIDLAGVAPDAKAAVMAQCQEALGPAIQPPSNSSAGLGAGT